jgi:hypothetical protein
LGAISSVGMMLLRHHRAGKTRALRGRGSSTAAATTPSRAGHGVNKVVHTN